MNIKQNNKSRLSCLPVLCTALSLIIFASCVSEKRNSLKSSERIIPSAEKNFDGKNWTYRTIGFGKDVFYTDTNYEGRRFFWCLAADDSRRIFTEPGCGFVYFDFLSQKTNEFIFKVNKVVGGPPLNLATGQIVERTNAVGKVYQVKLQGLDVVSVSEIK